MKEEINLLATASKKTKKMSPFFSVSLLILLISVIVVVGSLMYILFLKATLSSLIVNEKEVLTAMSKFDQQRVQLLTVSERLSVIKRIVSSKQEFMPRIGLVVSSVPAGMTVDTVDIQGNKVAMTVSAPSLATFNTFFNTTLLKLPQQKNSGIKKIDILSFSIGQNGGYTALINILYNTLLTQ